MAEKTDLSYINIDAETAYQFVKGEIDWQDVTAIEIFLGSVTLNQYIRDETFSLSDTVDVLLIIERAFSDGVSLADIAVMSVDKSVTNSLALNDAQQFSVDKPLSDSFSLSENVNVIMLGDASAVLNSSALNTYTLNS